MKPDLITCWIKHCDYPLYRQFLMKYRDFFGKVIILFSEHNRQPYFDHFIHTALEGYNITFLDSVDNFGKDWRHEATTEMLKHSTSEWVCSIEQDWFTTDWNKLLNETEKSMETADLIGWLNPTNSPYIHPSFFAIKREMLEKTSKDFSPHPEISGSDHFATITYEVKSLGGKIITLQEMGFNTNCSPDADAFHLGGVNQNVLNGLNEGFEFHRANIFYIYNKYCLNAQVTQDNRYVDIINKIQEKLHIYRSETWPILEHQWGKFFQL